MIPAMTFRRIRALYRRHFHDHRRERMFLASSFFLLTFCAARGLTDLGRHGDVPFQVEVGGVHVHHLVWGILLLLVVGYVWLYQVGAGVEGHWCRPGRSTAIRYGAGAALTLDEFALWLHLRDNYWEREGRASIDAVMIFAALSSAGLWGGPFLRALTRQVSRPFRRKVQNALHEVEGALQEIESAAPIIVPADPGDDFVPPPVGDR